MKTIGEILKQTRLQKKISLEEIEKVTRIRKKFLIDLEENQLGDLPAFTFSRGFLKNYSEFLGLNSNDLIAIFRRQLKLDEKTELLPVSVSEESFKFPVKITPTMGVVFVGALGAGIFIFYIISQYLSFFGKPYLKIDYPNKNLTVKSEVLEIKGKTDPDGKLSINGQEIIILSGGQFDEKIDLNKGDNKIIISVKNPAGKENKKEIRVNYQ